MSSRALVWSSAWIGLVALSASAAAQDTTVRLKDGTELRFDARTGVGSATMWQKQGPGSLREGARHLFQLRPEETRALARALQSAGRTSLEVELLGQGAVVLDGAPACTALDEVPAPLRSVLDVAERISRSVLDPKPIATYSADGSRLALDRLGRLRAERPGMGPPRLVPLTPQQQTTAMRMLDHLDHAGLERVAVDHAPGKRLLDLRAKDLQGQDVSHVATTAAELPPDLQRVLTELAEVARWELGRSDESWPVAYAFQQGGDELELLLDPERGGQGWLTRRKGSSGHGTRVELTPAERQALLAALPGPVAVVRQTGRSQLRPRPGGAPASEAALAALKRTLGQIAARLTAPDGGRPAAQGGPTGGILSKLPGGSPQR